MFITALWVIFLLTLRWRTNKSLCVLLLGYLEYDFRHRSYMHDQWLLD